MAKPAYVSEHPYYAPKVHHPKPLEHPPFYQPEGNCEPSNWASVSDVPSITAIAATTGSNSPSYRSKYDPFGPPGHVVDVDPLIIFYENMPDDCPNKPPKSWFEGRKRDLEFRVARAKALGYYPSQQQEGEENGEGEGEEQPTKNPGFSRVPYVLPPRQEPCISVRDFSTEERDIYSKMVFESDGFDCPDDAPPEIAVPCLLTLVPVEGLKGLRDLADLALKPYNDLNGTSYQLVKVIKATTMHDGGSKYKITLQAKDDATGSSPRNFQAYVTRFVDSTTKVHFCRVEQVSKPPRDQKSAVGLFEAGTEKSGAEAGSNISGIKNLQHIFSPSYNPLLKF